MKSLSIPNQMYLNRVKKIIYGKEIDIENTRCDFNTLRRKIFNNGSLESLLATNGIPTTYEISSGTSDIPCWNGYKKQLITDIKDNTYYRDYTTAKGNQDAREAIAYMESNKPLCKTTYEADDICLTEGSTGAITSIFEYLKQTYPDGEALISTPNYYLYAFAARYVKMAYKECFGVPTEKNPSFLSVDVLLEAITNKTKLVVITNPSNPSGEIYRRQDLLRLYTVCNKRNILLMVDELFGELIFSGQSYQYVDTVVPNNSKNLIIIKGFSKTKNLPGLRIGYALSKNRVLIDAISLISQERQCFPVASSFTGIICLDAFIWSVLNRQFCRKEQLQKSVQTIIQSFPKSKTLEQKTRRQLVAEVNSYITYRTTVLQMYANLYDFTVEKFKNDSEILMPKQTAFNTFIKIRFEKPVNYFDFMLNLYITTGVKIEFSPCFGLNQKQWENNSKLGFWLRITFAKDRKTLDEGIRRFIQFKKYYLANQNFYISTNMSCS